MTNTFQEKTGRPVTCEYFGQMGEQHVIASVALRHLSFHALHVYMQVQLYAVENFLKGYNLYLNGSSHTAFLLGKKAGHNIEKLIELCQRVDTTFLSWLKIVPSTVRNLPEKDIPEADLQLMFTDAEFYTMLAQGQDLKYLGTTLQGEKYRIIRGGESETVRQVIQEIISKIPTYTTASYLAAFMGPASQLTQQERKYVARYFPAGLTDS